MYFIRCGFAPLVGAQVPYYNYLRGTQNGLLPAESSSRVLHPLHHPIHILHVLPDEPPDSLVLRYRLISSSFQLVACLWSSDRHIIDVWLSHLGNFISQDVGNVLVKDGHRVGPSHRQRNQA